LANTDVLRAVLLASVTAGLGACASNPEGPGGPAPIDFRGSAPRAAVGPEAGVRQPQVMAPLAPAQQQAVAPPSDLVVQRVVDVGVSPTGTSAIEEAKAMRAEAATRPGGALRQVRDNPAARAIEVQPKDTLYDISRRYSVNMRALIETNALEPPYALSAGDVVYLPPPNVHVVEKGETLYSVSRRYNVDTRSLALLNSMQRPWAVYPGDELQLPPLAREQQREVVRPVTPAPVMAAKATPPPAPVKTQTAKAAPAPGLPIDDKPISLTAGTAASAVKAAPKPVAPVAAPAPSPPAPPKYTAPAAGASDFIWPISGQVLKGFGSGADGIRNDGVNIAATKGAQVKAAAGGEVVYAGSELAGFGNLILIRHPGGWVTAYAHSDALLVKEGDLVKQGQAIASAGATGNAPTTQVHFELRKGKEPVDPARHLPALKG
jgi:murein DD-endopeptidase MepM/ murein hydrolase activator NlpD